MVCKHVCRFGRQGYGRARCLYLSLPSVWRVRRGCGPHQRSCRAQRGSPLFSAEYRVNTLVLPIPLQSPELTLSQKIKAKLQNPDLLELCHLVPKEVIQLGEAWEAKMASALSALAL